MAARRLFQTIAARRGPTRSPYYWGAAAFIVLALLAAGEGARALGKHLRIGVDLQSRPCLPWRVYTVRPLTRPIAVGMIVAFRSEHMRRATSDEAAKIIRGMPGDRVFVRDHVFYLNNVPAARLFLCDSRHRPEYCDDRQYEIPPNRYVVLGLDEHSFDSRYWGPLARAEITGEARPLFGEMP